MSTCKKSYIIVVILVKSEHKAPNQPKGYGNNNNNKDKTIVRKPLMVKIIKLRFRNSENQTKANEKHSSSDSFQNNTSNKQE